MNNKEVKTQSNKEWHLDVSEDEYKAMQARGLDEESLFKPGRHTFRRRPAGKILQRDSKTVVIHLDEETYNFYRQRTASNGTLEEQIKAELRLLAEQSSVS
jgi:hypothetical protein